MKYALIFAALSIACIALVLQSSHAVPQVLGAWAALSWALLAFAFGARRAWVFGKRSDGTLQPLQVLALAPYHALNALSYALACASTREQAAHEIAPNVWLGRRLRISDHQVLEAMRPRAVLDACAEIPEMSALRQAPCKYLSLPLLDTFAPSSEELEEAARWIEEQSKEGSVLVHWALGHGRSATLVAAFLIRSGQAASAEQALEAIAKKRPHIEPSREQVQALQVLAVAERA